MSLTAITTHAASPPTVTTLSNALRERTAALHTRAERSGVISDILHRKADRRSYAILMRNLLPAYLEMESAFDRHSANPALQAFAVPELRRSDRIAADLVVLCGHHWNDLIPVLPQGERYAEDIAMAGQGNGRRLVAHAYVRYFGDLSGGFVLQRLLRNALDLPPEALTFYEFPGIANPKATKDAIRAAMDRDAAEFEDTESIIETGVRAFQHNIDISEAVQGLADSPVWQ